MTYEAYMDLHIYNARHVSEIDPSLYNLSEDQKCNVESLLQNHKHIKSVRDLQEHLNRVYCGRIGAEFLHLLESSEREWFADNFEKIVEEELDSEYKKLLSRVLLESEVWDVFMANKFQSVKRYGGEGAEAMLAFFVETFKQLAEDDVKQAVIGMPHRGRFNFMCVLLSFPPSAFFQKIRGSSEFPNNIRGSGDVISHLVTSVNLEFGKKNLYITMLPNPSHLEAVNPVVCGKTRARQHSLREGCYSLKATGRQADRVVCIQVHGDAAVSGQGVVQETLALSRVPHFDIGGSLHLVVNNQLGYTTPASQSRSSIYSTDIAKAADIPVLHANGDDPEAVVRAARLATQYQRKFRKDIFVDLVCWRRWGHNELDNPHFTNPVMYKNIDSRRSVPDLYSSSLVDAGILTWDEVQSVKMSFKNYLSNDLEKVDSYIPQPKHLEKQWIGLVQAPDAIEIWDTGVDIHTLKYLGAQSVKYPDQFPLHPQLLKAHIEPRLKSLLTGKNLDWATGEALAMASLLNQGYNVRISGQDVGRGTFSHRHCMFVNQNDDSVYIPLNNLGESQTNFLEVANSILSEEAVLGFEYGISVENPNTLCIWEAQFGDFYNGAQIIIDTFVSSGETKWLMQSGLTLSLPHGMDGAGPEHSSAHFERFLQNCDSKEEVPDGEDVNWCVAFPTKPSQYFHLLRRQMLRNYRKPLIIISPKVLLRHPEATSNLPEFEPGTHFLPVIGDASIGPDKVHKVIFVTGKLYYALAAERERRGIRDTAIVRVECLCPFPTEAINKELKKYRNAKNFVWSQEEHRNMGGWSFVAPRFENMCSIKLKYVGRCEQSAAATGIGNIHKKETSDILENSFL